MRVGVLGRAGRCQLERGANLRRFGLCVLFVLRYYYRRLLTLVCSGIVNRSTGDSAPDPTPTEPAPADIEAALTKLNAQLQQLHASLPPRTALVIFSGHSDPRRMAELNARKSAWEMAMKSGKNVEDLPREAYWSSANGRALEEEVAKAKRGLLFLSIIDLK